MTLFSSESPFLDSIWQLWAAMQQAAPRTAVHSFARSPARGIVAGCIFPG